MAAQLRGDTGAATHLSYYAELRAAMSLLASQGIGVFNSNHAIVKKNGDVEVFKQRGTHKFAWDVLEEWSRSSRSAAVVTTMVRPAGASLEEWYEAFTSGAKAKDEETNFCCTGDWTSSALRHRQSGPCRRQLRNADDPGVYAAIERASCAVRCLTLASARTRRQRAVWHRRSPPPAPHPRVGV